MADEPTPEEQLPDPQEVQQTRQAIETAVQTMQDTTKQFNSTQWMIKLTPIVFFLLLLAVVGQWKNESDETLLMQLADEGTARGLITLLFSVSTVWVVFQLMSYAISRHSNPQQFARGKEVLATLVGIFGTIVGYYFGIEAGKGGSPEPAAAVAVESPDSEEAEPTVEDKAPTAAEEAIDPVQSAADATTAKLKELEEANNKLQDSLEELAKKLDAQGAAEEYIAPTVLAPSKPSDQ